MFNLAAKYARCLSWKPSSIKGRFQTGATVNKAKSVLVAVALFFSSTLAFGQDGYFSNWFNRVDKTQSEQPRWITPVATTTPRLEEEVRYDQDWLQHADGYTWDEYDGAKGVELIPWYKTELIIQAPSVLQLQW